MKYIIGNWKANFTYNQANDWADEFLKKNLSLPLDIEIILCAPYPYLVLLSEKIKNIPQIKLGAQNISHFENGAYTGEITAAMISDLVKYTLIGHSERRKYFHEHEAMLEQKAELALEHNIQPIFCISNHNDQIPKNIKFVAYEPLEAIGTGKNESLEKVLEMKESLDLDPNTIFIYGGSVNESNAHEYISSPQIQGLLPGSASLDPTSFYNIIKSCLE
ncbi:MAG TPA: triose-phosphate isomerase family protein [Candidatus Nitrosocosmicus sp.]|nr:triose-phosphate isomerase family protein [Candidatus Nitrosocosmicus sp.]